MKKIAIAILVTCIVVAASAEVWYVPGWNRTTETNWLAYTSCTNVFKGNVCAFWGWDGDRSWSTSSANADVAAKRLAAEIVATNAAFCSELVIVGHSLGGRIVARTLAELSRRHDDGVQLGKCPEWRQGQLQRAFPVRHDRERISRPRAITFCRCSWILQQERQG